MAAGYLLFLDGYFSSYDGMLLMLGLGLLIFYLFHLAQHSRNDPMAKEITEELSSECKYPYLRLLLSLILLPISAHLIISSAVDIAKIMEISEVTIGLTIIAIGTSLPEVVTSLVGIYKGEDDIALGNIIGSNMFNILAVLPFAGILSPTQVPASVNTRDIPIMFFTSILLVVLIFAAKKSVNRLSGAILLIVYIGYLCLLFTSR
jgi:cation:H+ antiporter